MNKQLQLLTLLLILALIGHVGHYGPFEVDVTAGQMKKVQWKCDTGMQ